MTGLFEREVGPAWRTLHPRVRERYGLTAGEGHEAVGVGRMTDLARHPLAVPALWLGTLDDFLFPEGGTDVPFTIVTEPFVDCDGNEALTLRRRFETSPPRTFVDTLRWNPARGCLTDLFGHRGHVAADVHVDAEDGALALSIGTQWLRIGGRYLALPSPLSVDGRLRDWYDDEADRFRVAASITNPLLGRVFGYDGAFENELRPSDGDATARPALGGIALPGETA
ncbi:DUF4166 domain-containing protein [Natrinema longum]|uniref:DUF4166 domain-containing protein n=1 Tax=Natrinema longum TaxID=370324 RepID=A0A8A2UE24_9EURY|nr:DUF4166 domain-containing protein [Natrinema longum]MBZ6495129.1 DUF4166 domain-containing protein [Natrinema longum]QSW86887.1 DUF4166 domain-containing protein [Natrinema longum]